MDNLKINHIQENFLKLDILEEYIINNYILTFEFCLSIFIYFS